MMCRFLRLLAILSTTAVLLSGCILRNQEQEDMDEISLPEPTAETENMFLGESLSNAFSDITLYFPSPDGASFSTVTRSIRTEAGQSLPEAAVAALLDSADERIIRSIGDMHTLSFEYACGTATVNLSIDARNVQNPQELLALQTAIGNTLLGIDGVNGVNVLIGNLSEAYCQLPLGVQTQQITSVTASYAQLQAEQERISRQDSEPVVRNALLYFPTESGDWLVPELREISSDPDSFIAALVEALKAGPRQNECAIASIPEGVQLLDGEAFIRTLSNGERALDLNFSSTLANYLAFSGLEVWELVGSISLSMCSFLPELDAVRIMVNGDPVTMCEVGESLLQFTGGYIHRSDFSGCIGSTAILYLLNDSGNLQGIERAVSMRSALSPRSLLTELFRYAGPANDGMLLPLPDSIYPEDLLGIQAFGGIAKVNLSGRFYRICQVLNADDERALVYAMVNTLCELEGIQGVRFYVEGYPTDTLSGEIYLKSVLLPNPGIVSPKQQSAETEETG